MTPARALRTARDLITPAGAWLPCSFSARDAAGREVWVMSPDAAAWGVLGALSAVGTGQVETQAIIVALRAEAGVKHFCDWTAAEGRTQAEVLDAMGRAAERLDEERFGRAA